MKYRNWKKESHEKVKIVSVPQWFATPSGHNHQTVLSIQYFLYNFFLIRQKCGESKIFLQRNRKKITTIYHVHNKILVRIKPPSPPTKIKNKNHQNENEDFCKPWERIPWILLSSTAGKWVWRDERTNEQTIDGTLSKYQEILLLFIIIPSSTSTNAYSAATLFPAIFWALIIACGPITRPTKASTIGRSVNSKILTNF